MDVFLSNKRNTKNHNAMCLNSTYVYFKFFIFLLFLPDLELHKCLYVVVSQAMVSAVPPYPRL